VVGVGIKDFVDLCHIAHYNVILVSYFEHINKTSIRKMSLGGLLKGFFGESPGGWFFWGLILEY